VNLADTGSGLRSDTGQADEAFRRSVESLSRLLASRPADAPAPLPETEIFAARDTAIALRRRSATAILLLVAAIAAVGAGVYSFLQGAVPPQRTQRIETVAAAVPPPAIARPVNPSATIVPPPVDTAPVSSADLSPPKPVVSQPLDARGISDLQARLGRLGFSPGSIDGVAGPLTIAAIKRFQQSRGRAQTGAVDDDVLDQLRKEPAR
jgi:Fe2+ transport system protein FeoA